MCGIVGIFTQRIDALDKSILLCMRDAIIHRGPDDKGVSILLDQGIGLGHVRLSIIDLSSLGHQPMSNTDGSVIIVFNGEIYNFQEIRAELEQMGYSFISRTDTEVILHGYEAWGMEVVHRLNGMFAFAIWDKNKQQLWIVRDRLGKKPLYYWYDPADNTLLFASEIKALLKHPFVSRAVNVIGLNSYLMLGYTLPPYTMFRDIYKLPAGHSLSIGKDKPMSIDRYWKIPHSNLLWNSKLHSQHIRELIEDAVTRRLISDVPLGAFLSGGLDSSIIVGIMSKKLDKPVHTFSSAYEVGERSFKYNVDADAAEYVSRHFGTKHECFVITREHDLITHLKEMVHHLDEPYSSPSFLAIYMLAKYVKEHGITVILTGDGSDEIFGGYPRYQSDWNLDYLRKIPGSLRHSMISIFENLHKFPRFTNGLRKADIEPYTSTRYLTWWILLNFAELQQILSPDMLDLSKQVNEIIDCTLQDVCINNSQEAISYTDLSLWIPEDSNMRMDKMTMAHALESRSPFLDYTVVEYAMQLPFRQKTGYNVGKRLLKETFADILPNSIINRPKCGWFSPVHYWVRDFMWDFAKEMILQLPNTGIFHKNIRDLVNGKLPFNPRLIWMLMVWMIWYLEYIDETCISF